MKQKRIMLLFMSLFAITPAVLGSTWGAESRAKQGLKAECQLMDAKVLNKEIRAENVSGVAKDKKPATKNDVR